MTTNAPSPAVVRPGTRHAHRFDLADLPAAAASFGVSTDTAVAAARNVASGSIVLLGINGKLASGKDSVATATMEDLGVTEAVHVFYAQPLKAELGDVLAIVEASATPEAAARQLAGSMRFTTDQAYRFVDWFFEITRNTNHGLTGYSRTREVRSALQYLGTEVRRAQDEDYWVKLALRPALESMAEGRSVYCTDVRFPNEVLGAQRIGLVVARLEVSRANQISRLYARDGLQPDEAALNHLSETALDTFDGFNAVIDNNGPLAPTVRSLSDLLISHSAISAA